MAIEEQYQAGSFSETASEKLHNEAVNDDRKYRFNKTIQGYRVQNDLTTVKESIEGDSITQVFSESMNQPQSFGKRWNHSLKSNAKTGRLDDVDKSRQQNVDLYGSFNAK